MVPATNPLMIWSHMTVLVTGAAGFIGYHVSDALLARDVAVIGVDNLNDYYDVKLKEARLERLRRHKNFTFHRVNIADREAIAAAITDRSAINQVVHLAAQAGVRYSLVNPHAYVESNLMGQLVILEFCRALPDFEHLVYASSSSVYGGNLRPPFAVQDRADNPISFYGATKRGGELMVESYSHLYRLPATGLRFFTVYGPWGRPDMAAYAFTRAILAGEPIRVFNRGDMKRDFTYIDDTVGGVLAVLDGPPRDEGGAAAPHRLYNLGNNRPEPLLRYVAVLERALGRKAEIKLEPMQAGDIKETYADISTIQRDFGFEPKVAIDTGIPRFVDWYRKYHGV